MIEKGESQKVTTSTTTNTITSKMMTTLKMSTTIITVQSLMKFIMTTAKKMLAHNLYSRYQATNLPSVTTTRISTTAILTLASYLLVKRRQEMKQLSAEITEAKTTTTLRMTAVLLRTKTSRKRRLQQLWQERLG